MRLLRYSIISIGVVLGFTGLSCSKKNSTNKDNTLKIKVAIKTDNKNSPSSADSTTAINSDTPLFLGLNFVGENIEFAPKQISLVDNYIEVPVDVAVKVKARALKYKVNAGNNIQYYLTDIVENIKVTADQSELNLSFPAFKEALPINVYGVAVVDGVPAQNWEVTVKDPLTGANVTLPGVNSLALTNTDGSFSFKYLFASPAGDNENIVLEFTTPGKNKIVKNITLPAVKKPSYSAGYLNLTSDTSVMLGKSTLDFDGDGYTNIMEEAMGTNPFAVNSGACVPVAQVLQGFNYTCPDGAKLVGTFALTAGLNCWDTLGDVNKDGLKDAKDCMGATGPKGDKGDTGAAGAKGDAGNNGPQGYGVSILIGDETPGSNCTTGGKKIISFQDKNNNGTYEPSLGDTPIADTEKFICNGATGTSGSAGGSGLGFYSGSTYLGSYYPTYESSTLIPNLILAGSNPLSYLKLASTGVFGTFLPVANPAYYTSGNCTGSPYVDSNDGTLATGSGNYVKYESGASSNQTILSYFTEGVCNKIAPAGSFIAKNGANIAIFSNTSYKIYTSSDSGSTWTDFATLPTNPDYMQIMGGYLYIVISSPISPDSASGLYLYKTSLSSLSWTNIYTSTYQTNNERVLVKDANANNLFYNKKDNSTGQVLYKYDGTSETLVFDFGNSYTIKAVYANAPNIYVVYNNPIAFAGNSYFTYSTDDGSSWSTPSQIASGGFWGNSSLYANGNYVYLFNDQYMNLTTNNGGFFYSSNLGTSWITKSVGNSGIPSSMYSRGMVVEFDSGTPANSKIYLNGWTFVAYSGNNGASFTTLNSSKFGMSTSLYNLFSDNTGIYSVGNKGFSKYNSSTGAGQILGPAISENKTVYPSTVVVLPTAVPYPLGVITIKN